MGGEPNPPVDREASHQRARLPVGVNAVDAARAERARRATRGLGRSRAQVGPTAKGERGGRSRRQGVLVKVPGEQHRNPPEPSGRAQRRGDEGVAGGRSRRAALGRRVNLQHVDRPAPADEAGDVLKPAAKAGRSRRDGELAGGPGAQGGGQQSAASAVGRPKHQRTAEAPEARPEPVRRLDREPGLLHKEPQGVGEGRSHQPELPQSACDVGEHQPRGGGRSRPIAAGPGRGRSRVPRADRRRGRRGARRGRPARAGVGGLPDPHPPEPPTRARRGGRSRPRPNRALTGAAAPATAAGGRRAPRGRPEPPRRPCAPDAGQRRRPGRGDHPPPRRRPWPQPRPA